MMSFYPFAFKTLQLWKSDSYEKSEYDLFVGNFDYFYFWKKASVWLLWLTLKKNTSVLLSHSGAGFKILWPWSIHFNGASILAVSVASSASSVLIPWPGIPRSIPRRIPTDISENVHQEYSTLPFKHRITPYLSITSIFESAMSS